ncbi:ubiquitin carboxyl-terminal hydrolase-related protein [Actinidia rufa]|uniref:Ubiquitin carboxyl-terminal hydrolase-related protein n=1 Tax=Actinidia rufa TaxID=165716 RepID=A0A7J0F4P7_9ERIC|nr:ubiquitin carboxyl-terminal hydrolase-related protein [Actinidia rufa]
MAFVQILKLLYLYIGMSQTLDVKLNLKLRKEGLKKLWSIRDESKMRLNKSTLLNDIRKQKEQFQRSTVMMIKIILEPLTQKNGFPNGLEGVPVNTTDKAAQMTGLAIDIPEDGVLFNWQTGRKGVALEVIWKGLLDDIIYVPVSLRKSIGCASCDTAAVPSSGAGSASERHLKNAIESARKAVSLSRNSVELSVKGRSQLRILLIPRRKSFRMREGQQKILTADARIGHVQNEIQSLIEKLNTRRPNEIKKATKTPEERREIQVRVAAARLQKSESSRSQNDDNIALASSVGLCSESGGKLGDNCNGDTVECKSYGKVLAFSGKTLMGIRVTRHISYLIAGHCRMTLSVQSSLRKSFPYFQVLKYLGASHVNKEFSNSCGIGRYSERSIPVDDSNTDDAIGPTTCNVGCRNQVQFDVDALLSWMFTGPTNWEQLALWTCMKEEKATGNNELMLHHETAEAVYVLSQFHPTAIVQILKLLFLYMGMPQNKRKRNFDEPLTQKNGFPNGLEGEPVNGTNRAAQRTGLPNGIPEDGILSNELRMGRTENLNVSRFAIEETYSGVTSPLCDLELGEDDDWRTKDYLHQVDSCCIEVAMQRQKEQFAIELSNLDAMSYRNAAARS